MTLFAELQVTAEEFAGGWKITVPTDDEDGRDAHAMHPDLETAFRMAVPAMAETVAGAVA